MKPIGKKNTLALAILIFAIPSCAQQSPRQPDPGSLAVAGAAGQRAGISKVFFLHGSSAPQFKTVERPPAERSSTTPDAPLSQKVLRACESKSPLLRMRSSSPGKRQQARNVQPSSTATASLPWETEPTLPPDLFASMSEKQKKALQIVTLRNDIKERQRRSDLLMRLFVADEKDYLIGNDRWKQDNARERVQSQAAELCAKARELAELEKQLVSLEAAEPLVALNQTEGIR